MKFKEKLVLSHIIVSIISVVTSIILIDQLVRYFFIRIMIGRGVSIVIPASASRFLNSVRIAILISGGISIVVSIFVALFVSRYIIKPVIEMKNFARKISQGNFEARINEESDDEIGELAESLNYMAFRLGETEKLRTKLMQNVSHDLRTPLASIKGYLEVLKDESFSKEEKEEAFKIIENEIERLGKMAKDLTKLSSADSKTLPIELERINVVEIVKDTFDSFLIKIKEKGLNPVLEIPNKPIFIMGDSLKLREIFSNLIDNSIKFTNEGYVKISLIEEKDKVKVIVEDSGQGIHEKDIPHVFERFYKGENNKGGNEGMGLGLSIVKEYVYAHNGEIHVESEVGKGTKFSVQFPKVP
ncbi:sensor histidine kinase [Caldisericum exile]|uniref:histidine kinase n=1 Tax=Caldisericum exile (strain DSM 21853 / NBRC 104410 / AZM16c01) TaxID=511051 RepID=A0A7U6GEI5_CALEA|nr:HAMP domain-containing sensor histidine kinase [Caldisericum exile]BAL80906.1 two-component system sensor histidine kinase [Caldisericum exile AZM16c01]